MSDLHHGDTAVDIATKVAPPVSVSIATIAGIPVSDIVLWATLFYTVLMIGLKLFEIYRKVFQGERD